MTLQSPKRRIFISGRRHPAGASAIVEVYLWKKAMKIQEEECIFCVESRGKPVAGRIAATVC